MQIIGKGEADQPEIIDPGLVGEVISVDPHLINSLSSQGFIPVIAPVGVGENGETYNINADVVASKVASAIGAGRLILLTDVDGVKGADGNLISSIKTDEIVRMIESGVI